MYATTFVGELVVAIVLACVAAVACNASRDCSTSVYRATLHVCSSAHFLHSPHAGRACTVTVVSWARVIKRRLTRVRALATEALALVWVTSPPCDDGTQLDGLCVRCDRARVLARLHEPQLARSLEPTGQRRLQLDLRQALRNGAPVLFTHLRRTGGSSLERQLLLVCAPRAAVVAAVRRRLTCARARHDTRACAPARSHDSRVWPRPPRPPCGHVTRSVGSSAMRASTRGSLSLDWRSGAT